MRILVTGACGQLGMSLRPLLPDAVFTDVLEAPDTRSLDITDLAAIRRLVAEEGIDAIVNCAAYTNVDAAEDNPDLAERLNAQAVENLALAMKEKDGLLLHISTDYVFGAESLNTPIPETQQPAPLGVYGHTKLHGEQAIFRVGCRHIILRTAWLYSEYGKNFVKTMLRLTAEKPSLKVVFDQVGTPTYAGDLAAAIVAVLNEIHSPSARYDKNIPFSNTSVIPSEASVSQIYHFTNEGVCSWYDFTKAIAALSGQTACDIQPCHSDEFPSKVNRPAYSVLDKSLIKKTFGLSIPYWTDSLKRCLENLMAQ